MRQVAEWFLYLAVTVIGAALIAAAMSETASTRVGGYDLLLLSAAALFCGCLVTLGDAAGAARGLAHLLRHCGGVGVGTMLLLWWQAGTPLLAPVTLKLALGVAVLVFALGAIAELLARLLAGGRLVYWWLLCFAALLVAAPLWLAPAMSVFAFGQTAIDAVVAASPLSYLAALAQWDYLRGEWFYRHSPLGGLRYDYPSVQGATLAYLLLGLVCHGAGTLLDNRRESRGGRGGIKTRFSTQRGVRI